MQYIHLYVKGDFSKRLCWREKCTTTIYALCNIIYWFPLEIDFHCKLKDVIYGDFCAVQYFIFPRIFVFIRIYCAFALSLPLYIARYIRILYNTYSKGLICERVILLRENVIARIPFIYLSSELFFCNKFVVCVWYVLYSTVTSEANSILPCLTFKCNLI